MSAIVSSSPAPMAHPPRSNPFLRSSSVVPPFPCITPSTVTCVMVVSLTIVVPSREVGRGRQLLAAAHLCYERDARNRTRRHHGGWTPANERRRSPDL